MLKWRIEDMNRIEAINYLVSKYKYTIPDAKYIVDDLIGMKN